VVTSTVKPAAIQWRRQSKDTSPM